MNTIREARVERDLNNVTNQVNHLIGTLGDEGAQRLTGLRDRLVSVAGDWSTMAREKAGAAGQVVSTGARQAARVTDDYVHDNPWRAIGIGAAAGLLVGWLVSRR